jgi:hypothetical protein
VTRLVSALLCALLFAPLVLALLLGLPAWAQPAASPPSPVQAAFRDVLLKYDALADAETDVGRLRALEVERSRALAQVLGEGLPFDRWRLVLSASETTPMGGLFVRLHDAVPDAPRSLRPTYWNSGPGPIMRQAEISPKSPLHGPVALLKRGRLVVVTGNFFPDATGGPFYESARISAQDLLVERARFRMPYFSIRIVALDELFPERRFP